MADETPSPLPAAVSAARRLASAYQGVLGVEGKRSVDQQLVWADIESFCYAHRLCLEGKQDGDLASTYMMNEGRRSFYIRCRGMLQRAQAPAPTPLKVSRRKPTQP